MTMSHVRKIGVLRWAAGALLALALGACAPADRGLDEATAKEELAAFQDAWVAAEIAGDADALRALMDERMVTVLSSGETLDRESYIDWIVNMDVKPFTAVFDQIDFHGDTAILFSHIGANTKISWVAIKKDGRWQGVTQTFTKMQVAGSDAATAPIVTSLDALPREQLSPAIIRQALHGEKTTLSRWTLKAGSGVPMHSHANEQATVILSGRAVAKSGEQSYDLGSGDVMLFPPNVEHEFAIVEDAVVLDFFAPRRDDWIKTAAQQ